ncbi:hypothetical protein GCM10008917_18170 [Paraclostridium tenue]|uniref:Uncharacterized protein n=1 Tax=Paraclostridium tenue TaxID=1737 RepID=A0ABP3XFT0_9FIRM
MLIYTISILIIYILFYDFIQTINIIIDYLLYVIKQDKGTIMDVYNLIQEIYIFLFYKKRS